MSQIPAALVSYGTRAEVTLLPVGICEIQLGHSKRSQLLSRKMEDQIELCAKVCAIVTELHHNSPNFTPKFIQEIERSS